MQQLLNFTNVSRTRRHYSYIGELNTDKCYMINDQQYNRRLEFFLNTEDCEDEDLIPYKKLMYYYINPQDKQTEYLCVGLFLMFLAYMFVLLGSVTDKYFCPSLKALSMVFRMSENIAGVTLLAFGNGSPDLFSSLAQLNQDISVGKIYTEVMSGCLFVSVLVSGIILIIKPFSLSPASFLRDTLFLIMSILFIERSIDDGLFSLQEAILTILIYLIYITVVCIDQFLLSYMEKKVRKQLRNFNPNDKRYSLDSLTSQLDLIQSELEMDYGLDRRVSFAPQEAGKNYLLLQFWESLKPFDIKEFKEKKMFGKIVDLICTPGNILLAICIPVVDLDEERNGWSKLLNCLQWVTLPTFVLFVNGLLYKTSAEDDFSYAVPIATLVVGAVIGSIVFKTSNTYEAPKYHFIYYIMSSGSSMFFVYWLASNVVNILEVIGFITRLSKSFLGTTFLAVGNSLGDLLADITLAKTGYHKMAFSACFGGPLFNSVFGVALTFTMKIVTGNLNKKNSDWTTIGIEDATKGSLGNNVSLLTLMGLIGFVFALYLTNFISRRSIGIFNVIIYIIALIFNIFCEFGYIHAFGTDHKFDMTD